ncbi:SpoIIE family protein phosphatase [Guptibacillus algicola]|uniref:SpoIIE family protein phosphatase n=1 Tax=Guptibacillus algicola TaxID=225844 RepID=UPI001CD2ABE3|nr:SpoIIE family protein phosphatase [Alkalihalobacillus algicola]MCA0986493.1 SpoIIE family protein phosphatase [Alkalihalobacillus algicola]
MEDRFNFAPCGFLTLSEEGTILSANQTLLQLLGYELEQLMGENVNIILTVPARVFYQFYFVPIIKTGKPVEEMYFSLKSLDGVEIPVLINAVLRKGTREIDCVLVPMHKRNEYENELLIARKKAESALLEKRKANEKLEIALKELETKQAELMNLNEENQTFKTETKKELHLAKIIQEASLTSPIKNDFIQIESYYEASSDLSGDMFGVYQINPHQYGIIILDVMGHGISSSLITMSLQSVFQRLISKGVSPDFLMKELDNHLHGLFQNNEETWHYCTVIYLLINTFNQTVHYLNAGHPPALWQHNTYEQYELSSTCPPIGTFSNMNFDYETFNYEKGDRLLLYTDGVIDPYDSHYLSALLKRYPTVPLPVLKEKLLQLVEEQATYHQEDDKCFILIDLKDGVDVLNKGM